MRSLTKETRKSLASSNVESCWNANTSIPYRLPAGASQRASYKCRREFSKRLGLTWWISFRIERAKRRPVLSETWVRDVSEDSPLSLRNLLTYSKKPCWVPFPSDFYRNNTCKIMYFETCKFVYVVVSTSVWTLKYFSWAKILLALWLLAYSFLVIVLWGTHWSQNL